MEFLPILSFIPHSTSAWLSSSKFVIFAHPYFPVSYFCFATDIQTPNHILDMADVPPRHVRATMPSDVGYPAEERYTLQWLADPDPLVLGTIPNNSDAAFKRNTRKPKLSDLLLHYNYGAAAVKWWGHGTELLQNHATPPCPSMPVLAPVEAPKTMHDRTIAIAKHQKARATSVRNAIAGASGELVESEGKVSWDEDDVILFCWGNSRAAIERHRKKVEETTQRMERWRESVLQGSV